MHSLRAWPLDCTAVTPRACAVDAEMSQAEDEAVEVTVDNAASLRAFELKAFLKKAGLDASGSKPEMVRSRRALACRCRHCRHRISNHTRVAAATWRRRGGPCRQPAQGRWCAVAATAIGAPSTLLSYERRGVCLQVERALAYLSAAGAKGAPSDSKKRVSRDDAAGDARDGKRGKVGEEPAADTAAASAPAVPAKATAKAVPAAGAGKAAGDDESSDDDGFGPAAPQPARKAKGRRLCVSML